MKKIIILFFSIITIVSYSSFLEQLEQVDREIQNENYEKALDLGREILKSNLTKDEERSMRGILAEVEDKLKNKTILESVVDSNNSSEGDINETVLILPFEVLDDDKGKFGKYKEYENQVLSTNNSDAIYQLSLLYIKENLYESAMKLALKDSNRDIRNIYLAATAARLIGKYDQSINLYKEVLSRDSGHAKSLLGLAQAYKGKGNYKTALSYLEKYSAYDNSPEVMKEISNLSSK